ncbi:MAG: hypothetical protein JWP14_3079 [Frankiales bacterium]|nr:hypothetical protein [Frankiales bacterium]
MRLRRDKSQVPETAADTLRPLLLGNVPVGEWPPQDREVEDEPWQSFVAARDALAGGHDDEAVQIWTRIASTPSLESRQVLQAWTFLRAQGVLPSGTEAERVLGVVCDVAIGRQHDVLAAYSDGSSRYLNHSGKAVVAEGGPAEVTAATEAVIAAAAPLGAVIGVWDEPDLPAVAAGQGRLLLLTPGGFRFGHGPQDVLWKDAAAGPVLSAATGLMQLLTRAGG